MHAGRCATTDTSIAKSCSCGGGRLSVHIGGEPREAAAGDAVLYGPGVAHTERALVKTDMLFFGFRGSLRDGPTAVHDADGRMRVLGEWLLREQSSAYVQKQRMMDALLCAFMEEFAKSATPGPDPLIERVRGYMRDNIAEPLRVDDLANAVNMSPAHFSRTYRAASGRTPMEELRMMRVEVARDLVMTTSAPLKAIAPRVGFADEYHLSRTFRRILGVPPGYFRGRETT
jgi:AraC-like DNA-binding protein